MRFDWIDVLAPPIVAVVVFSLGWLATRSINGGRPLNPVQRIMAFFSFWFVLGTGYSMVVVGAFHWPHWAWIPPTVIWALFLSSFAWRRHRRIRELGNG